MLFSVEEDLEVPKELDAAAVKGESKEEVPDCTSTPLSGGVKPKGETCINTSCKLLNKPSNNKHGKLYFNNYNIS